MPKEIERKFLIDLKKFNEVVDKTTLEKKIIKQVYLPMEGTNVVRVRISNEEAYLTLKASTSSNLVRHEFEYEIPKDEANGIIETMCAGQILIDKTRYILPTHNSRYWEIDFFNGENVGLVIAEIELGSVEEKIELPIWILKEVTEDLRYNNYSLTETPYKNFS